MVFETDQKDFHVAINGASDYGSNAKIAHCRHGGEERRSFALCSRPCPRLNFLVQKIAKGLYDVSTAVPQFFFCPLVVNIQFVSY